MISWLHQWLLMNYLPLNEKIINEFKNVEKKHELPKVLYRGLSQTSTNETYFKNLNVNDIITYQELNRPSSWSEDPNIALKFALSNLNSNSGIVLCYKIKSD